MQDVRDKLAGDRQPVPARHAAAQHPEDRSRRARRSSPSPIYGPRDRKETDRDRGEEGQAGARNREGRRLDPADGRAQARDSAAAERRPAERATASRSIQVRNAITRQNIEVPGGPFTAGARGSRAPHDGPHPQRAGLQPHRARLPGRRLGDHVRRRRAASATRSRRSATRRAGCRRRAGRRIAQSQ